MNAVDSLDRLALEDPRAAAAAVDALWAQLAREDARMFAALWRRAHRPDQRREREAEPVVEWLDELEDAAALPAALPAVNLLPPRPAFERSARTSAEIARLLPV